MTIAVNDRRKEYPGNGVTQAFTGPRAFSASHIEVYLVDNTTQVATLQSAYTLGNVGVRNRQTLVTMDVAPPAGKTLLILRTVPYEQDTDITNQGAYHPQVVEDAMDALSQQLQQVADAQARTVRVADTAVGTVADLQLPAPVAGNAIGWSDDRTELVNIPPGGANANYRAAFADAVERTVGNKLGDVVSILDFGGVGDGIADDSAALASALAAGRIIDGAGRAFKINSPVALTGGVTLRNGTFNMAGLPDNAAGLTATGTLGSATAISGGAVARGATSFTLAASLSGLVDGTLLKLTADDQFTTAGTPVIQSEWVRVKSVAGNVVTIYGEVQFAYTSNAVVYKPALIGRVILDNCYFIGGGAGKGHKAMTATLCDVVRVINCRAQDFAVWCFGMVDCRDVKVSNIDGRNGDDTTNLSYLVSMSGTCETAQATNVSGENFRHIVVAGGTTGVVRSYQCTNIAGSKMTEATADAHPAVCLAQFTNIKHEGVTVAGSSDGIVSQALHTYINGADISKSTRFGVLVQPQCVLYAPTINVQNCRIREVADYAVSIDLQYSRVKLNTVRLENITSRGGTRGINISTGTLSLGCEYLLIAGCNMEGSSDRQISGSISTIIDSVEISGGKFKRADTASEVIHFNGASAGLLPFVRAIGVEAIGGTTGLRVINPGKAVVSGCRFSGWATAATTGLTHDGANIFNNTSVTT